MSCNNNNMNMKKQQLYIKLPNGRYAPYVEETHDTRLYIKRGNKYKPWGMDLKNNSLNEGVWVITTPREIAITIAEEPGKMPRKMKKAYRSTHQRETKWKRKAENYIKRKTYHAQHATIEITGNDWQTVSAEVRFDRLDRECDMCGNRSFRMTGKSENVIIHG